MSASFFDEFKEVGGRFVKAEEKDVLMEKGIPFQITGLIRDMENQYGPRFIANVLLPDAETGDVEERAIAFPIGTVAGRDRMLEQMESYFEREGDEAAEVIVKLEKVGRSIIIRNAAA